MRLRERAYFPGRYTKAESPQKQQTLRSYKQLPVNLPPLQLKNKVGGAKIKHYFICTLAISTIKESFFLARSTAVTGCGIHARMAHRP